MASRAVFDTNILVSAIGWNGNPRRCVELARAGLVTGLTCAEILQECERVLISKLGFTDEEAFSSVLDMMTFLKLVSIPGKLKVILSDPADDKIVECAVVGEATHIVTGDKKHLLSLGSYEGIAIVTAEQFLKREIE